MKKQIAYIGLIVVAVIQIQILINWRTVDENKFIQVFQESQFSPIESRIHLWVSYSRDYMSEDHKEMLLKTIAKNIDLEPAYIIDKDNQQVSLTKNSKNAKITLKLATVEDLTEEKNVMRVENYLMADLVIYENLESVLPYKNKLQEVFKTFGVEPQINISLLGEFAGALNSEQKEAIAKELLQGLQAKPKETFIYDNIYNIYAHTPLIKEEITSNGQKINIDLAFKYNQTQDKTYLYLATPLLTSAY